MGMCHSCCRFGSEPSSVEDMSGIEELASVHEDVTNTTITERSFIR